MYICVCKAVTNHQLEAAISEGLCTRKQLVKCFGVGRDCGKCNKEVHDLLRCRQDSELMVKSQCVNNH